MRLMSKRRIVLGTLLLLGFTSYSFAETKLPVSAQLTEEKITIVEEATVEIVPEIKIQTQTASLLTNPNLKTGIACSDENLEEAKGELFNVIPMAETIPCDKVDCNDLSAAKMHKDNYKELRNAKTIACDK